MQQSFANYSFSDESLRHKAMSALIASGYQAEWDPGYRTSRLKVVVRDGSRDAADVARIISRIDPAAKLKPPSVSSRYLVGYRDGRP
ncbi:hypothetical protein [Nocardioides jishulii]|uniref:Uncharacterized protein n=1 Tax=Nocardioides jishulii TaxID=2575440 RepID=A0A4U2YLX3_9ACTN|nr:hypothetical protein [Nocardioides jishulii]QCX28087.1 hypothetical protein FCL41_11585 [Nocardioides jishulii]TKI60751.1 hypothetical protein FC770_14660 [Nocardioides jishulii]